MPDKLKKDKDIDYSAEGSRPPEKEQPAATDQGYDEAAHTGASRYGVPEGEGGVFGTTGGGTYGGGMQIVERPVVYEQGEQEPESPEEPEKP